MRECKKVMLVDPDGKDNIAVDAAFARAWCEKLPGWTWRRLTADELFEEEKKI
jgi:hypothetical protein